VPYSPNSQCYFSLGPVGAAGTFINYEHMDQAMVEKEESLPGLGLDSPEDHELGQNH
jgi:hypothetical protein